MPSRFAGLRYLVKNNLIAVDGNGRRDPDTAPIEVGLDIQIDRS